MSEPDRTPVERLVGRDIADQGGSKFSNRMLQYERSVDSYLRAGIRPRWMERLMEIEVATKRAQRELRRARRRLRESCPEPATFARMWEQLAAEWDFDEVNELIRRHNEWYPIERDLPVNPRTGEYLPIMGRSYRRDELDAAWVLGQFGQSEKRPLRGLNGCG